VREGLTRCLELLEEKRGDPRAQASILAFVAGLEAMLGRFDEARTRLSRTRSIYEELGDQANIARSWAALCAYVEALAGDLVAAETAWREGCRILSDIGDVSFLASHQAELADVLCATGHLDEAEQLSELAEAGAASDDIYTQVAWRVARARAKAHRGDPSEAEPLAREAVALASKTDALVMTGRAYLALGEVVAADGRMTEAIEAATAGEAAFKQKGDVVSARKAAEVIRRLKADSVSVEVGRSP
jgi:tetratricopeptide (TPR) repeat protein